MTASVFKSIFIYKLGNDEGLKSSITVISKRIFREGNGTPLQYSCLENPMDRGAWWAEVHGVDKELDTTERLHFHFSLSCIGEGNGNPLWCSCLENPRDRGAWWAAVYGVAQSRRRLQQLSSSSSKRIFISTVKNCIFMQKIYPHGCFTDKHIESQKHQEIVTFLIKKLSLHGLSFLYDSSSHSTDLIYLCANTEFVRVPGNLNFIFIYICRVFTCICIHSINKRLKE